MRTFLLVAITACLLVPGLVFAEDNDDFDDDEMEDKLELRAMQLEIEGREMEMEFERQVQQIKLEKMRRDVQGHSKGGQMMDWYKKAGMMKDKCSSCMYKAAYGMDRGRFAQKDFKSKGGWHGKDKGKGPGGVFFLICIVVNTLLAVWVYKDIREKTNSSGIWIVVVLLTGLFGAIVYAIVRLGDMKRPQNV